MFCVVGKKIGEYDIVLDEFRTQAQAEESAKIFRKYLKEYNEVVVEKVSNAAQPNRLTRK